MGHHQGERFSRVGFIVTNLSLPSRAVVRFYNKRGTAEQWIKEGKQAVKMTRLSCHRFRSNEVRLWFSVIAYNPGEPVAAAGAAEEDRSLVADQLATAAGEDGRAVGEARPVLLAAVSGRSSDAAGVRGDSAEDLGAAPADWIGTGRRGRKPTEGRRWDGEVSEKSLAMRLADFFRTGREADLAPSGHRSRSGWKKFKKPAQTEAVGCRMTWYGKPKRKFRT